MNGVIVSAHNATTYLVTTNKYHVGLRMPMLPPALVFKCI